MGNIASGHFKPTNNIQEKHNDRTLSPSYLLPEEFRGQNEVNRSSDQARQLKERIIENAKETYLIAFKQKFKAKSYLWSLVVNTKADTTMSDLEKLAEHFEVKYGFQCYQIAIHRDEGYIDENTQEPHTNHHAHMEFVTLNKENGKNMWRQINHIKLRQIQTEIAQILGMERGVDKRISGARRIEPRAYAQMKNKERQELQAKNNEINTLKQEKTTIESIIQAKEKEIATALDTANTDFQKKKTTLQEATIRNHSNTEILSAIYHFLWRTAPNYVSKITEKYKQSEAFDKTFGVVKKFKEFYNKIVGKLYGDENAKKDDQEIINTITELQQRPTKQELEAKDKEIDTLKQDKTTLTNKLQEQATETQKAQERVKTLESNENALKNDLNAKESIIQATKQELQDKDKTINELNQFKNSSNLALDLEKAQERVKALESNENALKNDLNAKESIIQATKQELQDKDKTINELKKQIQDLEYNYNQERERMKAENKHLQEQGLEKIYTQKDYEALKAEHNEQIEALKKKLKEQDKYKIQAQSARYRQAQQRKAMETKQTPTPSPTPQQTYTPSKRI